MLYPTCVGPPQTLSSLFTVVSIIKSLFCLENTPPVRIPLLYLILWVKLFPSCENSELFEYLIFAILKLA